MLSKRVVLLSKDESSYNTDATPVAGTDAILAENLKWAFAHTRMAQRKPLRASLGELKPLYAGALISVSFDVEMKGSGIAGTPPEFGPLMRSSGWAETIVAVTSVTYKPNSTQSTMKSETMYFYDDGLLLKITGARGKCSGNLAVGAVGMLKFDFTGHFVSLTDVALPAATYDAQIPIPLINVPFTSDSYAAIISKLDFDLGVNLSFPESIAAADGFGEVQITGRKPTGSFDPQRTVKATYDWIAKFQSGAAGALNLATVGAVAGNKYAVTMPAITYIDVGRGDKNNIGLYEIKFAAAESTADDEIAIAFT